MCVESEETISLLLSIFCYTFLHLGPIGRIFRPIDKGHGAAATLVILQLDPMVARGEKCADSVGIWSLAERFVDPQLSIDVEPDQPSPAPVNR
jgi:hypothetical protein